MDVFFCLNKTTNVKWMSISDTKSKVKVNQNGNEINNIETLFLYLPVMYQNIVIVMTLYFVRNEFDSYLK